MVTTKSLFFPFLFHNLNNACGSDIMKQKEMQQDFVEVFQVTRAFLYLLYAEEYIVLDDNKYIGDLLSEFKSAKDRNKGEILHCKLVFKKRLFRESDEAVTDPMFVQLSYVQVLV